MVLELTAEIGVGGGDSVKRVGGAARRREPPRRHESLASSPARSTDGPRRHVRQLGGGFQRYSVDERGCPHFEKMLYDNAQLASLYLHACR